MSTNKFEVGDKVKLVSLDVNVIIYVSSMNKYLGCIGEVTNTSALGNVCVDFGDGHLSFLYPDNWLELVEKHKPKYWNGQFIVIKECSTKLWSPSISKYVVIGKTYTLNDGKMVLERGKLYHNYNYETFDKFAARLRDFGIEIIEFKGFCKNEEKDHNE